MTQTIIPVTGTQGAIVDAEIAVMLPKCTWQLRNGYAARCIGPKGKRTTQYMHRLILKAPRGIEVDHLNRNKLDNRRSNMRLASRSLNAANTVKSKSGKSGFIGVECRGRRFSAYMKVNCKKHRIGTFPTAMEAASARDAFARAHHGPHVTLNFVKLALGKKDDDE